VDPDRAAHDDEAATARGTWRIRLAAWGAVLVLAVVAFNVRAGAAPDVDNGANGEQRNGTTSQGQAIWAVVDGDRVRELSVTWEFTCDGGGELEPFGGTFRSGDFSYDGREFTIEDRSELPESEDGWVAHVKVELGGRSEADGGASGDSAAVMWFQRGDERGAVCRSGPVSWSVGS
jgi:hypothetical protein